MSDPKVDARARLRHDLRTPLHQIIGYAELLEDEVRDGGQGTSFVADLAKIRDAARKALEVVDEAVPPTTSAGEPVVFREPEPAPAEAPPPLPGDEPTIPLSPVRVPGAPLDPTGVRLLVVDDNELNRDMLSRRLGSRGYAVDVGIDVLKRVRQQASESDLPVIMATARDTTEDVVEALRLGANDYVTKPLDFAVVLARI